MIETQLQQLGFGKNEVKVYLALFELGKTRAGQVIEQTGLHRNLVYTALEELLRKGLISKVISSGVAVYEANSPESLQELFEDKVQTAKDVASELKSKSSDEPRDIRIYEGAEGLKRARSRFLNYQPGDTMYVFGTQGSSTAEMEKYWRVFHKKRVSKKIGLKILYERGVNPEDLAWRNSLPMSQAKYLPMNFNLPVWFSFIKDYLEIGVAGKDLLTFTIRNREAAGAFESFFNFFWNQKVIAETGIEALRRAIYEMLDELQPGEEYCVLGASSGGYKNDVQKLYDEFHTARIKKSVVTKMLVYKESLEQIKKRFERCGDREGEVSQIKSFLSAPPTPMQINLYKNKAFFIFYGDEPTVFRFEQPGIYDAFKAYFDTLWDQSVVTLTGMDALRRVYQDMLDELKPGEGYYIFGTSSGHLPHLEKFFDQYHTERIKRGVVLNMLAFEDYYETARARNKRVGDPEEKISHIKKYIASPLSHMQITLYNNKTRLIIFGDEPVVIYLDKPEIYLGFKAQFDDLWKKSV